MTKQADDKNEILYDMLSEKLYKHYCGEPQDVLSDKEVEALLTMMESLKKPDASFFNVEESWQRFKAKHKDYFDSAAVVESEESIPESTGPDPVNAWEKEESVANLLEIMEQDAEVQGISFWSAIGERMRGLRNCHVLRYVALTLSLIILAVIFTNTPGYANAKLGFFEFINKAKGGWEFLVIGDDGGFDMHKVDKSEFDTWEETISNTDFKDALLPEYIPEGLEITKIKIEDKDGKKTLRARYGEGEYKFEIGIGHYVKGVTKYNYVSDPEQYADEKPIGDKQVILYDFEDSVSAYFIYDKYTYSLDGNISMEEIIKIIEKMK